MRQVSLTFKIYGASNAYLKSLTEDVHHVLLRSNNRFKRAVYITAEKITTIAIVVIQTSCLPVIGLIAAIENLCISLTIHSKRGLVAAVKAAMQFSKMVALGNIAPLFSIFNSEKVYLSWMMYEQIVQSMAITLSCFPSSLNEALSDLRLRAVQDPNGLWTAAWRHELSDLLYQELASEPFLAQNCSDAPLDITDYRHVFEQLVARHRENVPVVPQQPVLNNGAVILQQHPVPAVEPSAPVLDDAAPSAPVAEQVQATRQEMVRLFEAAYVEKTPCRDVIQELAANGCTLDGKELMLAIIFQTLAAVRHELIEREIYTAEDIEEMGGSSYYGVLNLALFELARQKAFEWEERKLNFVATVASQEKTTALSSLFNEAQVKAFTNIVTQYRNMTAVKRGVGRIAEEIQLLRGALSRAKEYTFSPPHPGVVPDDSSVRALFDAVGTLFSDFEHRLLHESVGNERININLASIFKS